MEGVEGRAGYGWEKGLGMPELPEVETTRKGVEPHVLGQRIAGVEVRDRRLRWPVPEEVDGLVGRRVESVGRRGKYLLFGVGCGTVIVHLGMSGSLRICGGGWELRKHDHVVVRFGNGTEMRLHDPRRFGCVLFCEGEVGEHRLLRELGPEPLEDGFSAATLARAAKGKSVAIKQLIMNSHVVVGVGNIYACEALSMAGIHPARAAGRVGKARLERLAAAIKEVLGEAIEMGGTTLRDFLREDGEPGYFKQRLRVYDREGEACRACGGEVRRVVQGGRSTFYCGRCQR